MYLKGYCAEIRCGNDLFQWVPVRSIRCGRPSRHGIRVHVELQGQSLVPNLVSQGQVSTPVFSLYLAQSGSELYIGGMNQNHYKGSFTYMPVTTQVGIHDDAFSSVLTMIYCRVTGKARSMVFLSTGILLSVARVPSLTPAPPKSLVTPRVYRLSMTTSLAPKISAPGPGQVCS